MSALAYYNENNPFAVAWLRNLIADGLIAKGEVDERDIRDVRPSDLAGYTQCHFFAGIGVWSYALRQAGWPDNRPVWTGSCPCQPFSAAGKRKGTADERHLWPSWFHLISQCRPSAIFGEQVASKDGLTWLDLVSSDLEGAGYTIGAADTCAAGFGAPHIRQRLYWVADSSIPRRTQAGEYDGRPSSLSARFAECGRLGTVVNAASGQVGVSRCTREPRGADSGVADSQRASRESRGLAIKSSESVGAPSAGSHVESGRCGVAGELGDTDAARPQGPCLPRATDERNGSGECAVGAPSSTNGFWSACSWLPCIDGKSRPVEPGTFPLAHGVANRVGLLRGYGNSLVAPQAQAFIEACLETKAAEPELELETV